MHAASGRIGRFLNDDGAGVDGPVFRLQLGGGRQERGGWHRVWEQREGGKWLRMMESARLALTWPWVWVLVIEM